MGSEPHDGGFNAMLASEALASHLATGNSPMGGRRPSVDGRADGDSPSSALLRRNTTIGGRNRVVRETVGRLRVRCVGAKQLPANTADVRNLLRIGSNLNPYMLVYLRDRFDQKQSPQRRTRVVPRTINPQWKEEFWFGISKKKSEGLVLHVDVMDQATAQDDTVLGRATLSLDYNFLRDATHKRQVCDLELLPDESRRIANVSPGTARIEVSWEPSLQFNSASSVRTVIWVMLRSTNIIRVFGIAQIGTAGFLLIVAQSSRWLCRGPSLARCQVADVPGAETCALLSALGAFMAASVHFLGSAGLFGAGWDDRPPTMVELAEADIEEDEAQLDNFGAEDGSPSLRLSVQSSGAFPALRWDVDVSTNFLPKISIFPVRLLAWLLHLAATAIAELALVLCWANSGQSTFFAEAVYLTFSAFLCLIGAGVAFWHEGRVLRAQADKWQQQAEVENGGRFGGRNSFLMDGTGGSVGINSPSLNLEDLAQRAQRRLQTQIESVSNLAQPLMEARQRLQGRFDDPNLRDDLMRPLLDARQRLQEGLDDIGLTQPLAEARQRIQDQLDTLQQQQQQGGGNSGSPRSRNRAASLPPRWQSEELPRWMQPFVNGMQQWQQQQQQQQQQQSAAPPRGRAMGEASASPGGRRTSFAQQDSLRRGSTVSFSLPSQEVAIEQDTLRRTTTVSFGGGLANPDGLHEQEMDHEDAPNMDDPPVPRGRGLCCAARMS